MSRECAKLIREPGSLADDWDAANEAAVPPPGSLADDWDAANDAAMPPASAFSAEEAAFSGEEVAVHRTASDCWVIVHGHVYDVTAFLPEHPGGVSALSKPGRAGQDVTSHFERIGHSAAARGRLAGMRVGRLSSLPPQSAAAPSGTVEPATRTAAGLAHDHAVAWHGARRVAILAAHPEVANLVGDNPWTPVVGLLAGAAHTAVALYCGTLGLGPLVLCAATVGAVCSMMHFAVCHDLCHGTAGRHARRPWVKQLLLHACSLPSFGGETHHYYANQHIGHHAALGDVRMFDPGGAPRTPTHLDEVDGELPSPSTMLLLLGSSATVRRAMESFDRDSEGLLETDAAGLVGELLRRWAAIANPGGVAIKLLSHPLMQAFHLLMLTLMQLVAAVVMNPLMMALAVPFLAAPSASYDTLARRSGWLLAGQFAERVREADLAFPEWRAFGWEGLTFALHQWLWAGTLVAMWASAGPGAAGYLLLSELFAHRE